MDSISSNARSERARRLFIPAALGISFLILALLGSGIFAFNALKILDFREQRECNKPIGPSEAVARAGYNLGLPSGARDVRFRLRTQTQNTDLFMSYAASPDDIRTAMEKEFSFYRPAGDHGEHVEWGRSQIERKQFSLSMLVMAPLWWTPFFIKHGYYARASDGINEACYWVDTDRSIVFYYGHAD